MPAIAALDHSGVSRKVGTRRKKTMSAAARTVRNFPLREVR